MKVLVQRKHYTRNFFQKCRLQFRQPWRRISWNFKTSHQKPKTIFEKTICSKKWFSLKKNLWTSTFPFWKKFWKHSQEFRQKIFSQNPKTFIQELIFFEKVFFPQKKSFLRLECRFDNPDEKFPPNDRRYFSRSPKHFAKSNALSETFPLENVPLAQ